MELCAIDASNSNTLQELDAVKDENHTLQQRLQAARVHYTEVQKELKAIREERPSTVTALLETTSNWSIDIDNSLLDGVVYIDVKKAFDTIDHARL